MCSIPVSVPRRVRAGAAVPLLLLIAGALPAQTDSLTRRDSAATARRDSIRVLGGIKVTARREDTRVAPLQAITLPVSASVSRQRAEETVNLVDTEDAVKYLPSLFLRKRNNGDTQAVMGTRVWGVSSSARSLVYADGVPLTALIANNNTIGGPRWGLVAPVEISRVDMMYGPFSAAYGGNSMGAVMEITTRLPDKFEASLDHTQAVQTFSLYGTSKSYGTTQTNAAIGDRFGKLAVWASGGYANSFSQPLSYVTSTTVPTGTTGGYADRNKLGVNANVLGASGLLHTRMSNAKLKLAYDLTPAVRAAYTFGAWQNNADAGVESYTQRDGVATFAGQAGFASGAYALIQQHTSHSFSLRTDRKRDWDGELVASRYAFDKDQQRTPTTALASGATFGAAGRLASLDGTAWSTFDLKGAWHRGGLAARHTVSAGAHFDHYRLANPTFTLSDWRTASTQSGVATEGDGKTETAALWAQDAWRISPALRVTVGGRYETWRGFDGYNANGAASVVQPTVSASRFSPKASFAWTVTPEWSLTGSVAKAYRFATAAELYQLVSTGTTFTSPDPHLEPDDVLASELRLDRSFDRGSATIALFSQDVHDAITTQFQPLVPGSPTLYSVVSNVDHLRATGVELVLTSRDLLVRGLEFSGSATYLNARTLALSGRANATAPAGTAIGKRLPNIPDWRATFVTTYRPVERLALSVAGRYSGKLYTTLDNADVRFNTYQGFSEWFVADARANYRVDRHLSASLGVDNLLNRKYFLFHPFPQRTFVLSAKVGT
jgi:iron complex outermembrane receptor protein